jgi:hypothetical protein
MKTSALSKRVDDLSMKIVDEPKEHIARFDDSSFTDAEKLLFRKIEELQEQYGARLNPEVLEANKDLIFKAHEILLHYAVDTFRFTLLCFFGNPESQRDKNLFTLFFYNFLLDVRECLKEAQKHPESEDDFIRLMQKYDLFGKLSRIGGNADAAKSGVENQEYDLEKTEYSEDDDNEHYDRV